MYGSENRVEGNKVSEADVGFTTVGKKSEVTGNFAEKCNHSSYVVKSTDGFLRVTVLREERMDSWLCSSAGNSSNVVRVHATVSFLSSPKGATVVGNEISDCEYAVFSWFSEAETSNNAFTYNI